MNQKTDTERAIDKTLEIEAPPEAVWEALTDATELERWFPLQAEVEPGEGGKIFMGWDDYWQGTNDIEIWEPPHHLRTGWPVGGEAHDSSDDDASGGSPDADDASQGPPADGSVTQLAVDYYLEGAGGTTTLRLVHTGFGKGAEWDDWYEGTRRGWEYELECLRHYLENHKGTDRHVAWARHSIPRTGASAFQSVFGSDGLLTTGSIEGLEPGSPYALTAFDGTEVRGRVLVNDAGAQFAGTVETLNNACFRVESFAHGDTQQISVFVATWGISEDQVRALESRWQERLERLYA